MAFIGMTGQGATVTFATAQLSGCIRSIQLPEWIQEKIDASCLETVGFMRYIPSDLTDPGECALVIVFDPEDELPTLGEIDTITITLPLGTDTNVTPASLTGTGFFNNVGLPNLATGELAELNITFAFDGDTGPTWSKESAT